MAKKCWVDKIRFTLKAMLFPQWIEMDIFYLINQPIWCICERMFGFVFVAGVFFFSSSSSVTLDWTLSAHTSLNKCHRWRVRVCQYSQFLIERLLSGMALYHTEFQIHINTLVVSPKLFTFQSLAERISSFSLV